MATGNQTGSREITGLIVAEGTKRTYQRDDGSIETRDGGSVSWRNNNPGNLKFIYADSADKTVHTRRTKDEALSAAQSSYMGVVGLDQWGNAIFKTEEAGHAAQATLLTRQHGDRTVEKMLPSYAVNDYSGQANVKAYAQGIYVTGDAQGVDLRNKKISEMTSAEMSALQDGMKKVEGYRVGDTQLSPPSFRRTEEKSMQRMNEEGLAPQASTSITDPAHPGQPMFAQAQGHLQRINAQYGIPCTQQTDNAAACVAAAGKQAGMTRVDRLELNDNGSKLIAVQGTPGTAHSKVIGVDTMVALNTPLADSSQAFAVADAQARQQNQQRAQQVAQPAQAQAAAVLA